ncbi:MAG TPA: DUF1579 family protein [Fimbriimonadales bacterium]|nr:DUF1579 family protein [Fimbriimonadales bacterium]
MKNMSPFLIVLFAFSAFAQIIENPHVPEELKKIEFLLGNWNTKEKYYGSSPEPYEGTMEISFQKALSGTFLQGNYKGSMKRMGKHEDISFITYFEGMLLITYDNQSKKYRAWWFDVRWSDTPSMQPIELEGILEGNRLVFTSKPYSMPGMGDAIIRITYEKKNQNEVNFLLQTKGRGDFVKQIESVYTRGKTNLSVSSQ